MFYFGFNLYRKQCVSYISVTKGGDRFFKILTIIPFKNFPDWTLYILLFGLIKNPLLSDLIGGIKYVTLGDDEAKRRGTQKSILERKAYPAFEILIEINESNFWTIHEDVKTSVDTLLSENSLIGQTRSFLLPEKTQIKCETAFKSSKFGIQNSTSLNDSTILKNLSWTYNNR